MDAPSIAGWDDLVESLRSLPARMLAKLPERERADPQVQQEVGRLALAALTSSALETLASDPDHPVFVAQLSQALNVGQPNADTIYRAARISPDGVYRLRGRRGTLRMFVVAQFPPTPAEPGFQPSAGFNPIHDVNALGADDDGVFDVILSQQRPAGCSGDWWRLEPNTTRLLTRMVSSDWANERDPTISIERLDGPVTRPRPSAAVLEQGLRQLPRSMSFIGPLFVDHVEQLRREGYVNKLKVLDLTLGGGLEGQFYYEGAYELNDDEALLLQTKVPERCLYRSLILTNGLYETTDWCNNHSSLNDAQSQPDADGVLRVVISANDPGTPNWLDTAGYRQGLIQGRWTGCDEAPIPAIRKVAFAELRALLAPDTPMVSPERRERVIRDRLSAFQQRPLW